MRRFLIAIVCFAALPAIASAQRGGMGAGMARPAMAAPAPHIVMHSAPSAVAHPAAPTHAAGGVRWVRTRSGTIVARPIRTTPAPVRSSGGSNSTRRILSEDTNVPGLGFDYTHLAATHPQGNPGRDRNRQFVGAYFPFFGGGYYMPLFPDDVEEAPPAEAQQGDTGEPDQPAGSQRHSDTRQNYAVQNYPPAPEPTPKGESEEYVFVRRDGTVFFAVAYTWEGSTLRYVGSEGVRHVLASDKLDLDATQQFNEQRGLNFRVPTA